jgi:hypothetical protein
MPYAYVRAAAAGAPYSPADSVTLVVGDPWPGGARAQLRFPYAPGCEGLVAGESAELMVLCRDGAFRDFKARRLATPAGGPAAEARLGGPPRPGRPRRRAGARGGPPRAAVAGPRRAPRAPPC